MSTPITNPVAHGLRGLSHLTATLPTDPAAHTSWMATWGEAMDDGIRITSTEGIDALMRAIVDEERAAELESAIDTATAAHDAAEARLLALERAHHALGVFEEAADGLPAEDRALIGNLRTAGAWCALRAKIETVKLEVSRLEDVAHEATQALRAFEEVDEEGRAA